MVSEDGTRGKKNGAKSILGSNPFGKVEGGGEIFIFCLHPNMYHIFANSEHEVPSYQLWKNELLEHFHFYYYSHLQAFGPSALGGYLRF